MRGGTGNFCRLRGRLNSTVLPVWVSMLATVMLSVRMPVRSLPPSPPSSRTLSRGLFFQGSDALIAAPDLSSPEKMLESVSRSTYVAFAA